MSERRTTRLKRLVQAPEILVAPGVVDGIGARLVAKAGFDAIYMTGAGTRRPAGSACRMWACSP